MVFYDLGHLIQKINNLFWKGYHEIDENEDEDDIVDNFALLSSTFNTNMVNEELNEITSDVNAMSFVSNVQMSANPRLDVGEGEFQIQENEFDDVNDVDHGTGRIPIKELNIIIS